MVLYIDFDGVILDTIPVLYAELDKSNIPLNEDLRVREFFSLLDWQKIVDETPQINNSIECIKNVINANKYNVKVLTHVNSKQEEVAKTNYIHKFIPDLEVISVPKSIKKNEYLKIINNSILIDDFAGNLDEWTNAGGISVKFGTTTKESNYPKISRIDQVLDIDFNNK